ncbi:MAG: outer membrane lipoprotein-sorting protein [Pseudomonadota bacterium]
MSIPSSFMHSKLISILKNKKWILLSIFSLISFPAVAIDISDDNFGQEIQNHEDAGKRIVVEMRKRLNNYNDLQANINVQIFNDNNQIKKRQIKIKILEGKDLGDKTLTTFVSPLDQKGVALLTHSHKTKVNEQWLYLPAIKRVKKIAYRTQTSPFMGSEFTYEDIVPVEVEKFNYKLIKQANIDQEMIYFVEQIPTEKGSAYSRQIQWIDQNFRLRKIEYFSKENVLIKTMTLSDYNLIDDIFWHPKIMIMTNHSNGYKTVLQWFNYKVNSGFTEYDFTNLSLKREK